MVGLQAALRAYWQNVGESGTRVEFIRGHIYFVATPGKGGSNLGLGEVGELNHPIFWDHVGAVSGAGR